MSRLVYGSLTALISGMPAWLGYFLADLLTEAHFRFFPSRRHAALANLAVTMPRAGRRDRVRIARRMMRSYNRMMYEFFRLPHLSREQLLSSVEVVGREHLEAALARGRGVILASSHIGNWELAGVMIAQFGYTLHAVAGVQLGRWLTGAVRETKSELSIVTVSPEDGFRKLLRALEHNATFTSTAWTWSSSAAATASRPAPGCWRSAPAPRSSAATASGSRPAASAW